MASLITQSLFSSSSSSSSSSSLVLPRRQQHSVLVSFQRFSKLTPTSNLGLSCSCLARRGGVTKVWGGGGDPELEEDVLEFMKYSRNPDLFPSKEELIVAGRMDLVKRIVKQGGWLSYGWDLDDDQEMFQEMGNGKVGGEFLSGDSRVDQTRFDGGGADQCISLEGFEADARFSSGTSSYPPSSSGRVEAVEEAGIEGILSRLHKERNQSYGFGSNKGSRVLCSWNNEGENLKLGTQEVNGSESSSLESWSSDMWRKWSNRRAGVSEMEFEAAEFGEDIMRNDEMVNELSFNDQEKDYNHIRSCLQEMALELDSVLQLLKCTTDLVVSDKVLKYSPKELHSLSDAWEFRETEIIKAKNKLRSIQAQMAVVDGKKALKIIEAQQMVVEKQKKIHAGQKALTLLRTACVTWPKSASEVLLVGSFDGWTSQRKMERTSLGVFSMSLKLYPGRYEIKFIVDGMWVVDPLRPIVNNNNGYQNNLLVVS